MSMYHPTFLGKGGTLIPPFEASFGQVFKALNSLNETLTKAEEAAAQRRKEHRPYRPYDDDHGEEHSELSSPLEPPFVRLVGVQLFDQSAHYAVPNNCPSGLPPPEAYHQLYKMAACFHTMVRISVNRITRHVSFHTQHKTYTHPHPHHHTCFKIIINTSK